MWRREHASQASESLHLGQGDPSLTGEGGPVRVLRKDKVEIGNSGLGIHTLRVKGDPS